MTINYFSWPSIYRAYSLTIKNLLPKYDPAGHLSHELVTELYGALVGHFIQPDPSLLLTEGATHMLHVGSLSELICW